MMSVPIGLDLTGANALTYNDDEDNLQTEYNAVVTADTVFIVWTDNTLMVMSTFNLVWNVYCADFVGVVWIQATNYDSLAVNRKMVLVSML